MPTVQGAGSVIPTITAGNDAAVYAQATSFIQSAISTVVGGTGNVQQLTPSGGLTGIVVNTQFAASFNTAGFQYFVVADAVSPISVTAGGGLNQAVLLGSGQISFSEIGGSGLIVAGDGNKTINLGGGTNFGVYTGGGNDVITATSSPAAGRNTIEAGTGSNLISLGAASSAIRSTGQDTIAVSAGNTTVQALGNAQVSVSGGSGARTVVNAAGSSTVSGGSGNATVLGGAGGGQFAGGTGGNNLLVGGAGGSYLTGAGPGDVLIATSGLAMQVLQAGAGNETLLGSLSATNNVFSAGSGNDLIIAGTGNDTIYAGAGASTVTGGGYDVFLFNPLVARGGAVTITDFTPGTDRISLVGYADQPAYLAAAAQHPTGTSSKVVLSDGTSITFLGLSTVSASYFG